MATASKITGAGKYVDQVSEATDMLRELYSDYEKIGRATAAGMARILTDFPAVQHLLHSNNVGIL